MQPPQVASPWPLHPDSLQLQTFWQWVVLIMSTWEGSKWEQPSRKREERKKSLLLTHVCSHFPPWTLPSPPRPPLSISLCWQIKIHGLPSHPFSLHCLIVSKIEEITGRDLCTNKKLSETWQSIPWRRHAHKSLMICELGTSDLKSQHPMYFDADERPLYPQ